MGCNNTSTDPQFEAIFTTTDKEMRQIEQPMEMFNRKNPT